MEDRPRPLARVVQAGAAPVPVTCIYEHPLNARRMQMDVNCIRSNTPTYEHIVGRAVHLMRRKRLECRVGKEHLRRCYRVCWKKILPCAVRPEHTSLPLAPGRDIVRTPTIIVGICPCPYSNQIKVAKTSAQSVSVCQKSLISSLEAHVHSTCHGES